MKIKIKKGVDKIRITHNKKLLWIIIVLIILLIAVIYFIIQNKQNQNAGDNESTNNNINNNKNKNCVPATCCHATKCVLAEQAPDCSKAICSMVCSGPLDCGAGHCGLINNKCGVVSGKDN